MTLALEIRLSTPADHGAIEGLHRDAFPDEDLVPLVQDLLALGESVLSLVGVLETAIVGHVMFTRCNVGGDRNDAVLLGPVAVASAWQRRGVGSRLVRDGIERVRDDGIHAVFVLGDPAYYARFGFLPDAGVEPPYQLPRQYAEGWQSLWLNSSEARPTGTLAVPEPWRQKRLWQP
ncbi:MAG: N-acetyltransferase [Hyphomicrobiaceae bacterium]|nr:N-acetyltransferase [Hyphomicrobiaceae bacterium]